jgi:NCS1 family nucleobase:cation symporter-1
VLRRTQLRLRDLYDLNGVYRYANGVNWRAVIAFVIAVLPCLPGFLHQVNLFPSMPAFWNHLYTYAWFVTFFLAFVIYLVLMIGERNIATDEIR